MKNAWPKSLNDVAHKWHNEGIDLPPVGTRCRLSIGDAVYIDPLHMERNGKEVEIIAHIANGNLAVCVCYEHWAKNEVGEWWVAAFNSSAFQPIDEPFWPKANGEVAQ